MSLQEFCEPELYNSILSLLAFEASQSLKPWMQDVHNIVLQILEGVCNGM